MSYSEINKCRICGNTNLKTIINLGTQKLTGIFPVPCQEVPEAPLELVKCVGQCGLVQLKHSCSGIEMYGENYGYRSGLNKSMVAHLATITSYIKEKIEIKPLDLVIDIGSNDSTLLQSYGIDKVDYLGIDPTGVKFKKYYPNYIDLYPDFFSADNVRKVRDSKKAKVITSIAMFYDLEDPIAFAKDIAEVLDKDGIWVLEQSYLPAMIEARSFDTICQEHLEFYCLRQIEWIVTAANMKVVHVERNDANGGSFRIVVAHKDSDFETDSSVTNLREFESDNKFDDLNTYQNFNEDINNCKQEILDFLAKAKSEQKTVYGYGASTKGNVLLQYCGITNNDIVAIAEVNEDKFGHITPGTNIPIVSEKQAREAKPDYYLVLPWHFKDNILEKEKQYIKESGCAFVFPLPRLTVVRY